MIEKVSFDIGDLMTPGVVVEMTEEEARRFGAFQEAAVSDEEAEEANIDLVSEVANV